VLTLEAASWLVGPMEQCPLGVIPLIRTVSDGPADVASEAENGEFEDPSATGAPVEPAFPANALALMEPGGKLNVAPAKVKARVEG